MTRIIWKTTRPQGTCLSRYKARRRERQQAATQEKALLRRIAHCLDTASPRVARALRAAESVQISRLPRRLAVSDVKAIDPKQKGK